MTPSSSNVITPEDNKSVSTFNETKSTNSVKVIEVKEVQDNRTRKVSIKGHENGEIKNDGDQHDNDNKKEKAEENKDNGQIPTEDILSLEEILYRELEKFATAGVCWHLTKDKKRTLCMFFVRYQSNYIFTVSLLMPKLSPL